ELLDDADDYQPIGVVYNMLAGAKLRDSIQIDEEEVHAISWKIVDAAANEYATGTFDGPLVPNTFSAKGCTYRLNLGTPALEDVPNDPYLIVINVHATDDEDEEPYTEIHPLYILNAKTSTLAT